MYFVLIELIFLDGMHSETKKMSLLGKTLEERTFGMQQVREMKKPSKVKGPKEVGNRSL